MRVNFDANASVRPIPEVMESLAQYSGEFLNPSSVHQSGQAAKRVLDESRDAIARLLNVQGQDKIIFTSGATEANNAALLNTSEAKPFSVASGNSANAELICSSVEHSAVLEPLRHLSRKGLKLLEVEPEKIVRSESYSEMISDDLKIFALMAANNETGQIFDISKITKLIKAISPRTRVHCDAVQAVGKIEIDFSEWQVDTLAFSGHKLGALPGVGALVVSRYCHMEPWMFGGPQESGLRAGTENVLAIKSLGIACTEALRRLKSNDSRMSYAKELFLSYLNELGELVAVNSFGERQTPNTISVRFKGIKADDLVVALDLAGVSISAGSACASGRPSPSHVLIAHGMTAKEARETIRISFEPTISKDDLEFGLGAFKEVTSRILSQRRAA